MKPKITMRSNVERALIFLQPLNEYKGVSAPAETVEKGLTLLNARVFTAKETPITYRELNHWSSLGLLGGERGDDVRSWRKLSLRDLFWLRILKELRDFGLSLEAIKKIYDAVVALGKDGVGNHLDDAFAACCCAKPIKVYLVVNKMGGCKILSGAALKEFEAKTRTSVIRIFLNEMFYDITRDARALAGNTETAMMDITADEKLVVAAMREPAIRELRVKLRNGELKELELESKIDSPADIANAIKRSGFGEILTKFENGKIASVAVTKKIRPKK